MLSRMSGYQSEAAVRMRRLAALPFEPTSGVPSGRSKVWWPIRSILSHRELLGLLIRRDLKARYKDSALGFFWSLAKPLLQLAIYFVVMGHFLQAAKGIPDFAIYVFAGLTAMGLFTETVTGGTGSILSNAGLVKKVQLPREVFPLASVGGGLFNFGVQVLVLILATIVAGHPPLHPEVFYVLPALAILVIYATAAALLFSAINVYLRDMQYLVEVGTMLLFWASPVVYSWTMVKSIITSPLVLDIYTNNPLTLAVLGFQKAFWVSAPDSAFPSDLLLRMALALAVGVVALFLSHRVFLRLQGNFAQEL